MEGPGVASSGVSGMLPTRERFSELSRVREVLRPAAALAPPLAPTRGSLSSDAFFISSSSFFSRFLAKEGERE